MERLRQFIIDKTTAYEWRPGDRIPDVRSLAKRFDISSGSAGKVVREMADLGALEVVQGSGAYVLETARFVAPLRKLRNVFFMAPWPGIVESVQDDALKQGVLLSSYNTGKDGQRPDIEKTVLLSAARNDVEGIILLPTPLRPGNEMLYRYIRQRKIPLILIDYYAETLDPDGCYVLDDIVDGVRRLVDLAIERKARRFIEVPYIEGEEMPPYISLMRRTFHQVLREKGMSVADTVWIRKKAPGDKTNRLASFNSGFFEVVSAEAGEAAIFTFAQGMSHIVERLVDDMPADDLLRLYCTHSFAEIGSRRERTSLVKYSRSGLIHRAIEKLIDIMDTPRPCRELVSGVVVAESGVQSEPGV